MRTEEELRAQLKELRKRIKGGTYNKEEPAADIMAALTLMWVLGEDEPAMNTFREKAWGYVAEHGCKEFP